MIGRLPKRGVDAHIRQLQVAIRQQFPFSLPQVQEQLGLVVWKGEELSAWMAMERNLKEERTYPTEFLFLGPAKKSNKNEFCV